jgi:hypothetical protein
MIRVSQTLSFVISKEKLQRLKVEIICGGKEANDPDDLVGHPVANLEVLPSSTSIKRVRIRAQVGDLDDSLGVGTSSATRGSFKAYMGEPFVGVIQDLFNIRHSKPSPGPSTMEHTMGLGTLDPTILTCAQTCSQIPYESHNVYCLQMDDHRPRPEDL